MSDVPPLRPPDGPWPAGEGSAADRLEALHIGPSGRSRGRRRDRTEADAPAGCPGGQTPGRPSPVHPSPGPSSPGAPRPSRWRRRTLLAAIAAGLALVVAVIATFAYAQYRLGQVHRISVAGLSHDAGGGETILVVGTDSRAGNSGADAAHFGSDKAVSGQRSDTILLLHLEPGTRSASLMSIPRDLWVAIPGKGTKQRINTTFDVGPGLLVRAIHDDLGIAVDHFVEVDFQSFRRVVDAVGGVKVYFPTPARDAFSGLNITTPGCYGMSGDMALSFVRSRHYQYREGTRWIAEASSDEARIHRQQFFVRKMLAAAKSTGPLDLPRVNRILGGVAPNLTVDSHFGQGHMLSLARTYRNLTPDQLPSVTVPTTPAVIAGNDVLLLKEPEARQTIDSFLHPAPPPPPAAAAPGAPPPAPPAYPLPGLSGPLPPC